VEFEITVNGEWLTGTGKWDDMLKLYEVGKHNMSPAAQSDWEA
jgi:hypothetical protein